MYAARWFPFHEYAADLATSDISISIPNGLQLVGFSDAPVSANRRKIPLRQIQARSRRQLRIREIYEQNSCALPISNCSFTPKLSNDALVAAYGETLGRAMQFYTEKYGAPDSGKRLIVVQIDDESLDFYSTQGMIFMANRLFEQSREITQERLQREAAFQWWGLTVGLKSFDDAWISQGLAEYSAYSLRESTLTGAQLDNLRREILEKSLTFEQTASLTRTPATLDDQSTAYQYIMYDKGAFVFKLLRDTLGDGKV